jgi:alanyl-tRNA synthetase
MSPDELTAVEAAVNAYVRQDSPVETRIMTPDAAEAVGARALFGEKYGDEVRVVAMGTAPGSGIGPDRDTYSLELCGGTHVRRTGEIGTFKLVGEGASSSGVRRVEALTGDAALAHIAAHEEVVAEAAGLLRARPDEIPDRLRALIDERRAQAQEIAELRRRLAMAGEGSAASVEPIDVGGVPFFAQALSGVSGKDLRGLIDAHKARLGSGVIVLVADTGDRAAVAAGVTEDLTGRISAVDLVRAAAAELGGKGGGGRPDMAQAGGSDPARADEAIAAARGLVDAALSEGAT